MLLLARAKRSIVGTRQCRDSLPESAIRKKKFDALAYWTRTAACR